MRHIFGGTKTNFHTVKRSSRGIREKRAINIGNIELKLHISVLRPEPFENIRIKTHVKFFQNPKLKPEPDIFDDRDFFGY